MFLDHTPAMQIVVTLPNGTQGSTEGPFWVFGLNDLLTQMGVLQDGEKLAVLSQDEQKTLNKLNK